MNKRLDNIEKIINTPKQSGQTPKQPQNTKPSKAIIIEPKKSHTSTIIWLHGLHESAQKYLHIFKNQLFDHTKIIALQAPIRYVTLMKQNVTSWFDIKFRSEKSFIVPFDQAFCTAEVLESFKQYIRPWIVKARQELEQIKNGKLIIAGFSQGCGMSLHSFYEQKDKIDAVIGISGYLFPFTKFQKTQRFHKVLYGQDDDIRPWKYVKQTYKDKIPENRIIFLKNTKHQISQETVKAFHSTIRQIFKQ